MLIMELDKQRYRDTRIAIAFRPVIPSAEQIVTSYEVEGRHGSLNKLGAYKDVEFDLVFNVLGTDNVKSRLRRFKGFLLGKKTIRFSDDDVYREIKSIKVGDIENQVEKYGKFTIRFRCGPFEHAIVDAYSITNNSKEYNFGTYYSQPKFTIYGTGNIELITNGNRLIISNVSEYIEIDSLARTYRKGINNISEQTTGKFPILEVGQNTISWTGSVSKVILEPRWRYV